MNIPERLTDNLVACTKLSKEVVAELDGPKTGPLELGAKVTLERLSENLSFHIKASVAQSGFARPSLLAHVTAFTNNVQTAIQTLSKGEDYAALPQQLREDFNEWQGLIALVALNAVYGYAGLALSMERETIGQGILDKTLLQEMEKSAYAPAVKDGSGELFYLCQKGHPIALFHPSYGLCPLSSYSADDIGEAVPWYNPEKGSADAHRGWESLVNWEKTQSRQSEFLESYELDRLSWWARGFGHTAYADALDALMGVTNTNEQRSRPYPDATILKQEDCFHMAAAIDAYWKDKGSAFGSVLCLYSDGVAKALPGLFQDKLLIQYVGRPEDNRCVYVDADENNRPVCFEGSHDFLAAYAPVLPFTEAAADFLSVCKVRYLKFTPLCDGEELVGVRLEAAFLYQPDSDRSESFTLWKSYTQEQLYRTRLSHLMVWPYVAMPSDLPWKTYYATWSRSNKDGVTLNALPIAHFIDYRFDNIGEAQKQRAESHSLRYYNSSTEPWTTVTSDAPFRFAMLRCKRINDDGSTINIEAMICFPLPPQRKDWNRNDKYTLAVDFGTTSTVCAYTNDPVAGSPQNLAYRDYSECVTCYDALAKEIIEMVRWMGDVTEDEITGKIFSVAQLFQQDAGKGRSTNQRQKLFIDGRLALIGPRFTRITTGVDDSKDPLRAQRIANDMKFGSEADELNNQAAVIFLSSLYMYATLDLLSKGIVPDFSLIVSFPNAVTLNALKSSWAGAGSLLTAMMDEQLLKGLDPQKINYCKEAKAAAAYHGNSNIPLSISLDIGGGTTDISIFRNRMGSTESRGLSVRYAGREIMVDSLLQLYRYWYMDEDYSGSNGGFDALWNQSGENQMLVDGTLNLLHALPHGDKVTEKHLEEILSNSTLRMNTELLLHAGLRIGTAQTEPKNNFLRELITLKFMMIMAITAEMVANNLDLWGLQNGLEEGKRISLNLVVSGTSAQLLQYIFNAPNLADINALPNGNKDYEPLMNIFSHQFAAAICRKLGMEDQEERVRRSITLKLSVDQHVREKKEVCYGLLKLAGKKAPGTIDDDVYSSSELSPDDEEDEKFEMRYEDDEETFIWDEDGEESLERIDEERISEQMQLFNIERFQEYLKGVPGVKNSSDGIPGLRKLLLTYEDKYLKNIQTYDVGLGKVRKLSELISVKYYSDNDLLETCQNAVAGKMAHYMTDKEQSPYFDILMSTYLLEEYINRLLIRFQLRGSY